LAVEMEIFPERNVIQKSWSAKKISVPAPKPGARSPPLSDVTMKGARTCKSKDQQTESNAVGLLL